MEEYELTLLSYLPFSTQWANNPKVDLPKGEVEYLITSLLDIEKYPFEDFSALYFKRWGSETNFDIWKNKTQIENFSGHSVEAIYQDFYATVFTANIHSLFVQDCEEELEQINQVARIGLCY